MATPVSENVLLQALQAVVDPTTGRDWMSTKAVKDLRLQAQPGTGNGTGTGTGRRGGRVGILDADIYGPSQPMTMGLSGRPESLDGKRMAAEHGVDYLGALPLSLSIREQADSGRPSVVAEPDSEIAATYRAVARQVSASIALKARDFSAKFPTISGSKST